MRTDNMVNVKNQTFCRECKQFLFDACFVCGKDKSKVLRRTWSFTHFWNQAVSCEVCEDCLKPQRLDYEWSEMKARAPEVSELLQPDVFCFSDDQDRWRSSVIQYMLLKNNCLALQPCDRIDTRDLHDFRNLCFEDQEGIRKRILGIVKEPRRRWLEPAQLASAELVTPEMLKDVYMRAMAALKAKADLTAVDRRTITKQLACSYAEHLGILASDSSAKCVAFLEEATKHVGSGTTPALPALDDHGQHNDTAENPQRPGDSR